MKYYFKPISVSESIWIFEELVKNGYEFMDWEGSIDSIDDTTFYHYPFICIDDTRKKCQTGDDITIMDHNEITFKELFRFNIKKPVFRLDREHIKMVFI